MAPSSAPSPPPPPAPPVRTSADAQSSSPPPPQLSTVNTESLGPPHPPQPAPRALIPLGTDNTSAPAPAAADKGRVRFAAPPAAVTTNDDDPDMVCTEFVFVNTEGAGEKDVKLAGSWNGWYPIQMYKEDTEGTWSVLTPCPRGRVEFKFVVDGQWVLSTNHPSTTDDVAEANNVRVIKGPPRNEAPLASQATALIAARRFSCRKQM